MNMFRRNREKMPDVIEKAVPQFMAGEIESAPLKTVESAKKTEYRDFIDAYRMLPWFYAGITAIASAAVKPILRIYKDVKQGQEIERVEITGEEINERIARPNDFMSYREMMQITVINILVTGNHYWKLVGAGDEPISQENPPVEIWWIKPEQIDIDPDKDNFIGKYIYTSPTGKPKDLDPSEIIHFKLANPDSYFRGLSPMEPMKNTAIMEFNAVAYNKSFFANDAVPLFYFYSEKPISEKQRNQHRAEWKKIHKGTKKAGNFGYCSGGLEIKELGKGPKDASYPELRKMNREEILAAIPGSVPPSVVGLLEYANYANMKVQDKKFWEDCVMSILAIIVDKLNLNFAPHFGDGYRFEFDYSNIDALQEDRKEKSEIAKNLISHGIKTPNQIRAELYGGESYEGGDKYYMPMSLIEVGQQPQPKKTPKMVEGKSLSYWQEPRRKKILWDNFIKRVTIKEEPFALKVDEYLLGQAEKIRTVLEKLKAEDIPNIRIAELFDQDKEEKAYFDKMKQRYFNAFVEAGEAGMAISKGVLYDPEIKKIYKDSGGFNFSEALKAQVEKIIMKSGEKINAKTVKELLKKITQAQSEGWTIEELTQNLLGTKGSPGPWFSHNRSRRIANTEMCDIENFGQLEGYKQNLVVELKGWLCAMLPTSREAHQMADAEYADNPIPLDEVFIVDGEELQYPGDPNGSAGNIIECHCTTYPEVGQI